MGSKNLKIALIITLAISLPGLFVSLPGMANASPQATNRDTNNLNVLFLGCKDHTLQMISVYSINYLHNMKSVAIFFPSEAIVRDDQNSKTLEEIFARDGAIGLKQALEETLGVSIAYHVWMDQRILPEVERFIGPIYVDGKKLKMEKLFTMPLTPDDEKILGAVMERFSQPGVYFWQLPRIIAVFHKYINTDFELNLDSLMMHYRIARRVDPQTISKIVVQGRLEKRVGKKVLLVTKPNLKNVVYLYTR